MMRSSRRESLAPTASPEKRSGPGSELTGSVVLERSARDHAERQSEAGGRVHQPASRRERLPDVELDEMADDGPRPSRRPPWLRVVDESGRAERFFFSKFRKHVGQKGRLDAGAVVGGRRDGEPDGPRRSAPRTRGRRAGA